MEEKLLSDVRICSPNGFSRCNSSWLTVSFVGSSENCFYFQLELSSETLLDGCQQKIDESNMFHSVALVFFMDPSSLILFFVKVSNNQSYWIKVPKALIWIIMKCFIGFHIKKTCNLKMSRLLANEHQHCFWTGNFTFVPQSQIVQWTLSFCDGLKGFSLRFGCFRQSSLRPLATQIVIKPVLPVLAKFQSIRCFFRRCFSLADKWKTLARKYTPLTNKSSAQPLQRTFVFLLRFQQQLFLLMYFL